jgi:hypothetical protein
MQPVGVCFVAGQLANRVPPELGCQDEDRFSGRNLRAGRRHKAIARPGRLEAAEDGGMRHLDRLESNHRPRVVGQALLQREPSGQSRIEPEDERILPAPGWGKIIQVWLGPESARQHLHKVGLGAAPIGSGE